MKRILSSSIFARILLAALLPLILIFSLVIVVIAKSVFHASAEVARERTLAFARQSAEQVQDNLIGASRLAELAAKGLALMAGDSDRAREAALGFMRQIFINAPNAYRLRMYFEPGKDAFGTAGSFAYVFYHENGTVVRAPLNEPELSSPWYAIPLKAGVPYHNSIAYGRFGMNWEPGYAATTNYPVIRDGKVIGCVGIGLFYRKSFSFIDQREADGNYRLLLVSKQGTILYATDASLIDRDIDSLGFAPDFLGNIKNAMRQNTAFMDEGYSPVFGKESLVCVYPVYMPKTTAHIFVYMDTPTELVYDKAMASVRTVLAASLIGLLLFAGSLFVATRSIVKPIKKITENANLIANGQFDAILDEFDKFDGSRETRDEIYSLARSLWKMLKELLNNHELKIAAMESEHKKVKMEEAAAAKNRFFANMSHEIRTPMNVILGMSEILLTEDLTKDQKKLVQDIKISSESLLDIVNDILDLSRLESGKLSLSPVHYNFRTFMENVCSVGKYLAKRKELDFRFETAGDMPEYLYGDDGRLRQVLLNIVGNAVKFTEKGSVTMAVADEDKALRFDIVDTGVGVREEDMRYLFEPFKQIENTAIRKAKGTGLGLSICRILIELMDGAIAVDSEYGKGSSFHVAIPKVLGDGGKVEKMGEALPLAFDSNSRVLVVDDSESNLKVAREFLKMFGIAADTASSGAAAIAMAKDSNYDLILMDHMMPEMDGVETTHRIRALGDRQAGIPIIALTANAVIGSREMLLASGINDFLAKPIEKIKFQAMLAKWLPEHLVIRENQYALGSRFAFSSAQTAGIDDGTDGNGKRRSDASRTTRVLTRVSELKDLDIALGLELMAGNRNLYEELLGMMAETVPAALAKIDAALAKGDSAGLNIEIHTLKGSLANLGAVELADRAAALEQMIGREDFSVFTERLRPFRQNIEAFARKLRDKLSEGGGGRQLLAPDGGLRLEDAVRELQNALSAFDYGKSMEIVAELARFDWGEAHNSGIKAMHSQVKRFDYDAALGELRRVFPETL